MIKCNVSPRQINVQLTLAGWAAAARWVPDWVRMPLWLMHAGNYMF